MALPTSGAISFSNIQTEFGGSHPIRMSEYYGLDSVTGDIPSGSVGTLIRMSNFRGAEAAFATATRVVNVNGSGDISYSGTIDCSGGPAGQTWAVAIWRAGSGGSVSYPSNAPSVNGTSLTFRAGRTTYYSDDGSASACWASQITPSSSVSFSWNPNTQGGGYPNTDGFQIWIVKGVDSLATTISTVGSSGAGSQTFNYNTPYCIIAGGGQAKGSGSLGSNFDTATYGLGGDRYATGSTTANYGACQSVTGVVLSYGTNNAVIV
jgi:hypothetical protein